jgi:glycosyltransferase involved in cell wall biosynthesis
MLFSVIIPTYNREQYLRETIDSVMRQTFTDYELIVVDDGSTDGTADYVASLGPGVRLLKQSNAGPGVARNTGAAAAKGEYLAFLDSDDLWSPWTLAVMAEIVESYERPTLINGCARPLSEVPVQEACHEGALQALHFSSYLASISESAPTVGSGTTTIRRDAFQAAGGFPDHRMNAEDHDFILRIGACRGFVQIVSPWTLGLRDHHENVSARMDKNAGGLMYILTQEKSGRYPGDGPLKSNRLRIITTHVRPVALKCLKAGMFREAWSLYAQTFWWHLGMLRIKFLFGFILVFAWNALLGRRGHHHNGQAPRPA